jgi:RNA polymerase sigma factor (TIGR02999 family)
MNSLNPKVADVSTDVTQLLEAIDSGDPKAADQLLPLVYEELRKLAAVRMAQEKAGQTLQPTALVHEAWMKLAGSNQDWSGRGHFFGAAAEAMRRILIDKARRKSAQKRGSGVEHDELHESQIELKVPADEFLAVNDAVDALAEADEFAAQIVKLRYFVGMTNREIASALEMAPRSVDRHWAYGRAWLKDALKARG